MTNFEKLKNMTPEQIAAEFMIFRPSDACFDDENSITIQGLSSDTYSLDFKLTYKKIQLEQQRAEIENFLDSVQDSKIRRIIRLKYIKGNTWKRTAFILGWHDEQIPRKKLERFLSKYEMYENTDV